MDKFKDVFGSKNFYVTVLNIVLGLLLANDVIISMSAEDILTGLENKDAIGIIVFLVANFANVFIKIFAKFSAGTWSWAWLGSSNFWVQVLSVLTIVLTAWLGEVTAGLIVVIVGNVINLIYHLQKEP